MAPLGHCGNARIPLRLTTTPPMLDIGTEWTLSASLVRLSSYRKCSKQRIPGHSAQPTSVLPIAGTTKCSHIVRGFASGSSTGFAADLSIRSSISQNNNGTNLAKHLLYSLNAIFASSFKYREPYATSPECDVLSSKIQGLVYHTCEKVNEQCSSANTRFSTFSRHTKQKLKETIQAFKADYLLNASEQDALRFARRKSRLGSPYGLCRVAVGSASTMNLSSRKRKAAAWRQRPYLSRLNPTLSEFSFGHAFAPKLPSPCASRRASGNRSDVSLP